MKHYGKNLEAHSLRGHERLELTSAQARFMFNMHYRKILKVRVYLGFFHI